MPPPPPPPVPILWVVIRGWGFLPGFHAHSPEMLKKTLFLFPHEYLPSSEGSCQRRKSSLFHQLLHPMAGVLGVSLHPMLKGHRLMMLSSPFAGMRLSASAFCVLSGEFRVHYFILTKLCFYMDSHNHFSACSKRNVCISSYIHTLQLSPQCIGTKNWILGSSEPQGQLPRWY